MTGLPFFEGFAPARLRTIGACLESAEAVLREEHEAEKAVDDYVASLPLDTRNLVGEDVVAVAKHPHGWSMRFGSGACIVFPSGVTLDSVGIAVIEP